jgi:hypothetical protein
MNETSCEEIKRLGNIKVQNKDIYSPYGKKIEMAKSQAQLCEINKIVSDTYKAAEESQSFAPTSDKIIMGFGSDALEGFSGFRRCDVMHLNEEINNVPSWLSIFKKQ